MKLRNIVMTSPLSSNTTRRKNKLREEDPKEDPACPRTSSGTFLDLNDGSENAALFSPTKSTAAVTLTTDIDDEEEEVESEGVSKRWGVRRAVYTVAVLLICILAFVGIAMAHQSILSLYVYPMRKLRLFRAAEIAAKAQGKPLLIIGDPYSGTMDKLYGPLYHCGDMCIDLTGCPNCENKMEVNLDTVYATRHIEGSKLWKLREKGPYVIFVSHTLDYVSNLESAFASLAFLAESSDDIYIFYGNESWSSAFPFKYTQHYILETAPPMTPCIKYRSANLIKRLTGPRASRGNLCPKYWGESAI